MPAQAGIQGWGLGMGSSWYPVINMKEFFIEVSTADIQREKNRARELRRSEWWKRKRAAGVCFYCQRRFPPEELTMDHLIPLVRGGRSTKGNLVPACKECNSKKKYALPWEWENES
jgi:5-methylcytosine-specific restriction endonuclease McrA